MNLHELLEQTGLSERTLRDWHQKGLVPHPVTTAGDHGYDDGHVTRILAICKLRDEDGVRSHEALSARIDAMSAPELARFVYGEEADDRDTEPPPGAEPSPAQRIDLSVTEHVRIPLRDGLVLEIRKPIEEGSWALVQSIASLCGVEVSIR